MREETLDSQQTDHTMYSYLSGESNIYSCVPDPFLKLPSAVMVLKLNL